MSSEKWRPFCFGLNLWWFNVEVEVARKPLLKYMCIACTRATNVDLSFDMNNYRIWILHNEPSVGYMVSTLKQNTPWQTKEKEQSTEINTENIGDVKNKYWVKIIKSEKQYLNRVTV